MAHNKVTLRERRPFTITELDCKLRCIRANIISMKVTMRNLDRALDDVQSAITILEEMN